MKEQLITRKEFIALVERVKRKGLSYNEIARRINMPSPVLYNIRKGKPASFDALHVASLKDLIKEYENPAPPPPTFATYNDILDLKKEMRKELIGLRKELALLKKDFAEQIMKKNILSGKKAEKEKNGPNL